MAWFKIWYDNAEHIGTALEDWRSLPDDGVVFVYEFFYYDEYGIPYGRVSAGSDYYWMTPDSQVAQSGASSETPGEWLPCEFPADAVIKRGRWVSTERLDQVTAEVMELVTHGPKI